MSKIIRIFLSFVLVFYFMAPANAWARYRKHSARGTFSAQSAFLWNASQNKIYFAKNIHQRIYPASTTKVMTIMLALEKLPLDQYVTVGPRATDVAPTKLDLRSGEQYRVDDLIYACLLKSANDAAIVLAEAMAGSQEKFVEMMNEKAASIGANETHFINPNGLPGKGSQYTTARDMALILREAIKNPFFQKAVTFPYRVIYSKTGRRHFLKSHNKALFWKQNVYGKTGYTLQAKSCFVGFLKKGNDILIVDVFHCNTLRRWTDLKWLIEHYAGIDL